MKGEKCFSFLTVDRALLNLPEICLKYQIWEQPDSCLLWQSSKCVRMEIMSLLTSCMDIFVLLQLRRIFYYSMGMIGKTLKKTVCLRMGI